MASYMLVRHKVKSFADWKHGYDAHLPKRIEAGLTEKQLLRGANDPNEVVLLLRHRISPARRPSLSHRISGIPWRRSGLLIGAGGGSIATVNSLGLLQVEPESAAADPGPICDHDEIRPGQIPAARGLHRDLEATFETSGSTGWDRSRRWRTERVVIKR